VRQNGCVIELLVPLHGAPFPEGVPLTSVCSRGDGVVW
jgi:hypothetical protein